jgi:hypothetical protein
MFNHLLHTHLKEFDVQVYFQSNALVSRSHFYVVTLMIIQKARFSYPAIQLRSLPNTASREIAPH